MDNSKKINSFQNLEVWKLSHEIVLDLYETTKQFPKNEEYRITAQLLRAVVSIPTNIAEGMGRFSRKEFVQFLIISRGSLEECKYLILLSKDLGFIDIEKYNSFNEKFNLLGKKLNAFINSIKTTTTNNQQPTTNNQ